MQGKLSRSRTDRMIAGVGGGLAQYLGVDPTIVRIVFVLLAISGIGILLYVLMWLIVPEAPAGAELPAERRPSSDPAIIVGVVLIALGAYYLLRNLGFPWLAFIDSRVIVPVIIIALGLLLLFRRRGA